MTLKPINTFQILSCSSDFNTIFNFKSVLRNTLHLCLCIVTMQNNVTINRQRCYVLRNIDLKLKWHSVTINRQNWKALHIIDLKLKHVVCRGVLASKFGSQCKSYRCAWFHWWWPVLYTATSGRTICFSAPSERDYIGGVCGFASPRQFPHSTIAAEFEM